MQAIPELAVSKERYKKKFSEFTALDSSKIVQHSERRVDPRSATRSCYKYQ